MKLKLTPGELKQAHRDALAKQVLRDRYISLKIDKEFDIKENFRDDTTKIYCEVGLSGSKNNSSLFVEGSGRGPVDAFFSALSHQLSEHFCSLDTLRFSEFAANADLANTRFSPSGSDAPVEAILVVNNDQGNEFVFRDSSRSINKAAINVVLKAVEHFINSEEAVISLYCAIIDAEKRNRGDLFDRYTLQLAELVEKVSYEAPIKKRAKKWNYNSEEYED